MQEESKSLESLYLKSEYAKLKSELLNNKQSYDPGWFHFTLGTIYAKEGNYPVARFHLEKAIKEGYLTSETLTNLEYVKEHLPTTMVENLNGHNYLEWMMLIPSRGYYSMTLVLALLAVFFLKITKRWMLPGVLVILAITPLALKWGVVDQYYMGIALEDLKGREGPSEIYEIKVDIPKGSKFIVTKERDGWFLVKYPIDFAGWIGRKNLGLY